MQDSADQSTKHILNYAPPAQRFTRTSERVFWAIFPALAIAIFLIPWPKIGDAASGSVFVPIALGLWMVSYVLLMMRRRSAYLFGGLWLILLWLPWCVVITGKLYRAYLGTAIWPEMTTLPYELALFLPLTAMLFYLVWFRPWR